MFVENMKKEFDKVVVNKDEETCHLKNHSQILITHINKLKNEKMLQQETQEKLNKK